MSFDHDMPVLFLLFSVPVCLSIYAKDENGRLFNCEVQRRDSHANPQRARFHSSMLDVRALKSKEDFDKIRDTYVIFITGDTESRKDTSGLEKSNGETDISDRKDEGYSEKDRRTCGTDKGID